MDSSSNIWVLVGALAFFLVLTALAAAAETALTALIRSRLKSVTGHAMSHSAAIQSLLHDPQRLIVTLLILNGLGLIGSASVATLLSLHLSPRGWVEFLLLLLLALLLIAIAQVVPKSWAACQPEQVAGLVAGPINLWATLLWPGIRLFGLISRAIGLIANGQPVTLDEGLMTREKELRLLVNAGDQESLIVIEDDEKEMITGVFELGETLTREVMVPRIDVVAVDADTPLLEALEMIIQHGHSRIPVYEKSIDHIIGVLYVKDLLRYLRDGRMDVPLQEIVREAYFIPESKHLDELLEELQRRKVHMAIVVDEYGGTAGLVTIEDLLEEIVGEIQDEYDREEPVMEQLSENEAIFNARVDLDDVNRLMSLDLPTDQGDTLGGLVYSQLGKVPIQGDTVQVDGVTIEVLSVSGRRIRKVRIVRQGPGMASQPSQFVDPEKSMPADLLRDGV